MAVARGIHEVRIASIRNGTIPTQARPSQASSSSSTGTSGRTASSGTLQCTKRSSRQRWVPALAPGGRWVGDRRSRASACIEPAR